jgi:hypothetical protein
LKAARYWKCTFILYSQGIVLSLTNKQTKLLIIMKKILVFLSLFCFIAVNISLAQTASTASKKEVKTEAASVKADAKADDGGMKCCKKVNKACCSNNTTSKACTPAQKAACAATGEKEAKAETEDPTSKGSN